MDEKTGVYNAPFLGPEQRLVRGWRRMQGLFFRAGAPRFEGKRTPGAVHSVGLKFQGMSASTPLLGHRSAIRSSVSWAQA
jgi:hypothetical protein